MVDIGYTTAPGDYQDYTYTSTLVATKLTADQTGNLQSLSIYMRGTGGGNVTLGLYSHDAANNRPGTLLATTASTASSATNAYQTIATTTSPAVSSGTVYWIVYEFSAQAANLVDYDLGITGARYGTYSQAYGDLPATWPGALSYAYDELANMVYGTLSSETPNTGSAAFSPFAASGEGAVGEAPIPFCAEVSTIASGTTSVTANMPATREANRILVAFLESANQVISVSNGNGLTWTETYAQQGTGTAGGTAATRLAAYWARDNGTAGAPTFACASGNHVCVSVAAFVGCIESGSPIHVSYGSVKTPASTSVSIPGGTTTVDDCLIVAAASKQTDSAAEQFSGFANSSLGGVTKVIDIGTTTGNGGGYAVATGTLATAGTFNATTATGPSSTNGNISFALLPKETGGPTGVGTAAFSPFAASGEGGVSVNGVGTAAFSSFAADGRQSPPPVSGSGAAALSSFAASGTGTVTPVGGQVQVDLLGDPLAATGTTFYADYGPCAFVDVVTGDLVWIQDDGGTSLLVYVQTGQDVAPALVATVTTSLGGIKACAQGSTGTVHVCGDYAGGFQYSRLTLTRSGDHVTGVTSATAPFGMPTMNNSLGGTPWGCVMAVIPNENGVERIFVARVDGSDSTQYCSAVTHGPITASATADFTTLSGTANAWTKFPTQTASVNVGAPYCFSIVIERNDSTGSSFFVVCGASSRGDVANYACSLVGFLCTPDSGTTWTFNAGSPRTLAAESYESMCGGTCRDADGNAYFLWTSRSTDSGPVTVGLSKVAIDGTFTANWISTTANYGGELRGYPAVCSDGTVILALDPGDTGNSGTRPEIKVYSKGAWHSYWGASTQWGTLGWVTHGSRGWVDGLLWSVGDSAYPAQSCLGSVRRRTGSEVGVFYTNYSDPSVSSAGGTTTAPTYPDAVPDANTQYVLITGQKPSTANSGTITLPGGWTELGSIFGAGGYGETLGLGTGNVNLKIGVLDTPTGDESGSTTVGLATNNVAWSLMVRADKMGSGPWEYAATTGSDVTGGATLSVAYGDTIDLAPGDLVVVGWCQPTNVTTRFTAPTLTAAGFTFGRVTTVARPTSATGNTIGGLVCFARVLTGSGAAAVTFAAVAGGVTTNVRGGSVLVRLRRQTVAAPRRSAFSVKCLFKCLR